MHSSNRWSCVGAVLGSVKVGNAVGMLASGALDGASVGVLVGALDGATVGVVLGEEDGFIEGENEGEVDGRVVVGGRVGFVVGCSDDGAIDGGLEHSKATSISPPTIT